MSRSRRIRLLFAAVVAVQLALIPTRAQSPRPMGIVDLLSVPRLADPRLSPDGREVVFTKSDADWKSGKRITHIWRARVDGGAPVQLTYGTENENTPRWSPDGRTIAFTTKRGDNEFAQVYLLPVDGGEAKALTSHGSAASEIEWTPDGSALLFTAPEPKTSEEKERDKAKDDVYSFDENYKQTHLWKVDVKTGSETRLTSGDFSVTSYTVSDDGRKIVVHRQPTPLLGSGADSEVWVLNADGSGGIQVTKNTVQETNGSLSPDDAQVLFLAGANARFEDYYNGRLFIAPAAGGAPNAAAAMVEGILTYPVDYQPGQKVPLAVMTHGGPQAADKYSIGSMSYEIQVLAGKGYATLQPNYRGSTGYGDAFLRNMVGHYFQQAHLDVMTGVDEVIRRGIADPDRMLKMGWSGGGHMTNKIITFTDRFKAAAAGAGAANWISMYAQSDIRSFRTPWFGGTPWQANAPIDTYWNNSPLKDVANVRTPTLFFVGERDPRVPMPQSIEMYRALKANGVPTHLYSAPRRPHGWGALRHQLYKLNAEIEWFEKYATNRPFTWEKAPGDEKKESRPTTDQPQ